MREKGFVLVKGLLLLYLGSVLNFGPVSSVALAQSYTDINTDAQAMMTSIVSILQLTSFVDATETFCIERVPETAGLVQQAALQWRNSSGIYLLDQVLTAHPDLPAQINPMEAALRSEMYQNLSTRAVGREGEWCQNFPTLLQGANWDVQANYASELEQLRRFITNVTGEEPLPQPIALEAVASPSFNQVIAAGINPNRQFIPDEFRCYDATQLDYSRPHFIVQITGNQYLSSYGGGRYSLEQGTDSPDIEWLSGPLAENSSSRLRYGEYGQSFHLAKDVECFQQGASEARVLTQFHLKEPKLGSYQCIEAETNQVQTLNLLAGNTYSFANFKGEYELVELLEDSDSTRINWLSGPFAEERSYYSEEAGTGLRRFSLSVSESIGNGLFAVGSSSQLAFVCTSRGEAVEFQNYGEGLAPAIPRGDVQLDGHYYRLDNRYSGLYYYDVPVYMRFFPNGYVFTGIPGVESNEADCSRNAPNGAPFCMSYQVLGNQITMTDQIGESWKTTFSQNAGKTTIALDGDVFTAIEANVPTRLEGVFVSFDGSGTTLCLTAYCNVSYTEKALGFKADNTFLMNTDSESSLTMNLLASTYSSSSSSSANSGRYSIEGNTLTLHYNNSVSRSSFIHSLDESSLIIDGEIYNLERGE